MTKKKKEKPFLLCPNSAVNTVYPNVVVQEKKKRKNRRGKKVSLSVE